MAGAINPQTLQAWGLGSPTNMGQQPIPTQNGPMPPGVGAGGQAPAHAFPSFEQWGGKDGAKNFVMPDNPYKIRDNAPADYNKIAGHMANNQSWSPASYFGGAPMNDRYAGYANMTGNSYAGQMGPPQASPGAKGAFPSADALMAAGINQGPAGKLASGQMNPLEWLGRGDFDKRAGKLQTAMGAKG